MSDSIQELKSLKANLENEIEGHRKEIARLTEVIAAIEKVEALLRREKQATIPAINPYENIGPSEIVQAVVNSSSSEWSLIEIIKAAQEGGRKITNPRSEYPNFYKAATRLSEKGVIRLIKKDNGKVVFRKGDIQQQNLTLVTVEKAKVDRFHPAKKVTAYVAEILADKQTPMSLSTLCTEIRERGGNISNKNTLRTLLKREPDVFAKNKNGLWCLAKSGPKGTSTESR
ncbi:MAG: hypothetical protein NTZ09_07635 [Candidatus Hydrogenedentes bacterium]|nr:hypothetical protein [Candidatus Hydrogenedentota bacterium]